MCPKIVKCLAALDVISQNAGDDNFKNIKASMKTIEILRPMLSSDVNDLLCILEEVEKYIKKDFINDSHFGTNIPPEDMIYKCHCPYYCFGKEDLNVFNKPENACECNHVHQQICANCQVMNVFLNKFNNVIEKFQINSVESSEANVDAALLSNFSKLRNQLIY